MLRIIYFSFFPILFSLFLISGHDAISNVEDKTKKAILLALLKNTFIDNEEYKEPNDLNNALENINNMNIHPTDNKKFDNFLEELFKHYNVHVTFSDMDKRILHTSGVFNDIYVDVNSLDKGNTKEYFNGIHKKALSLINLVLHSNLVHPKYAEINIEKGSQTGNDLIQENSQDTEGEPKGNTGEGHEPVYDFKNNQGGEPDNAYGHIQGEEPVHEYEYNQGGEPDNACEHIQGEEPVHEYEYNQGEEPVHEYEYSQGEEPVHEYEYNQGEEPVHEYEYNQGEEPVHEYEHNQEGESDNAYELYHGGDITEEYYDNEGHNEENYKNKNIKYVGKKLKNLLAMKNIKLNNNSTGEFKVNFYTNYVNYISPYSINPFPSSQDMHKDNKVYEEGRNGKEEKYDEYSGGVSDGDKDDSSGSHGGYYAGKEEGETEDGYNKYRNAIRNIYEKMNNQSEEEHEYEENAGEEQGKEGNKEWERDWYKDENSEGERCKRDEHFVEEETEYADSYFDGEDDVNRKYTEEEQTEYSQKDDVEGMQLGNKSPTGEKKGLNFSYTFYNPYYMYRLGSKIPDNEKINKNDKSYHIVKKQEKLVGEEKWKDSTSIDYENITNKNSVEYFFNTLLELADYVAKNMNKSNLSGNGKKKKHLGDQHVLLQNGKNRPIYKKKEMKSKKMKTKKDEIDENMVNKIKDTMYFKVGQNGTNNFLNFFDFREDTLKKNFTDLLLIMEQLKVFTISETIMFIQKFTETICASYCMGITDVLELSNNDMLLYEKMSIHFDSKGMTVILENTEHHFSDTEFERILNLLNINKDTIPLTCPCKFYTNSIISYCKQYKSSLKGYFEQSKKAEYIDKFSISYILQQLENLQEKLYYIKKNGKLECKQSSKCYDGNDLYNTAYYHNERYFPTITTLNVSDGCSNGNDGSDGSDRSDGSGGSGGSDGSDGSGDEGNQVKTEVHLKYPDVETINVYYNASPVNLKNVNDVKNVLIEEVKSKIFYINSYRIGNQFFHTYSNFGKDDHDLEIMEAVNTSKSKGENNSVRQEYYRNGKKEGNRRGEGKYVGGKGGEKSRVNSELAYFASPTVDELLKQSKGENSGHSADSADASSIANTANAVDVEGDDQSDSARDSGDWVPLKSPKNHEDFYNERKRYTNLFEDKTEKKKKNVVEDRLNLKYDFLEKKDKENYNTDDTNLINSVKLKSRMRGTNAEKKKKVINAKYLIYFFKNIHVWKTSVYCQNMNYIDNLLKNINYNEDIVFQESVENGTVSLLFSSNLKDIYKIDMDYFIFLLQKISLIMYVEDLCGIFQLDEVKKNKKIDKYLEKKGNIHHFLEKHIIFSHEQYIKKNKYARKLSDVSTSNFFSSKKDIIFNPEPYNNVIFNEKEIYESLHTYMEDVLTEKMLNETWLTPYGFMLYSPNKANSKYKLKISQNVHITKYSRNAIDKYIYYEYKKISNNIIQYYEELNPKIHEYSDDLKEYKLVIYNDNPSMTNIIIRTTVNVLNIAFLQSLLEVILDIRADQQFFSFKGKFLPVNAFLILDEGINYLFFNYVPNENHINFTSLKLGKKIEKDLSDKIYVVRDDHLERTNE
ncbi:hypothetical protein POVCU2_0017410 [Plasmodium ovale curtisi]|uniref:Merozoite surface protein MSA180 n=1 Tax=Plasmodium ovale curtisi TaxID=864141 RepID=A0A1A8VU11_PLAOA|nr:hypothetical protein POVCU2_0017410 [Plasmodium ovale curtisi]